MWKIKVFHSMLSTTYLLLSLSWHSFVSFVTFQHPSTFLLVPYVNQLDLCTIYHVTNYLQMFRICKGYPLTQILTTRNYLLFFLVLKLFWFYSKNMTGLFIALQPYHLYICCTYLLVIKLNLNNLKSAMHAIQLLIS